MLSIVWPMAPGIAGHLYTGMQAMPCNSTAAAVCKAYVTQVEFFPVVTKIVHSNFGK